MISYVYVENPPANQVGAPPARDSRPISGRVAYVKVCNEDRFWVLADFFPDGTEDFADQEPGEVRWHRYTPSEQERIFARSLLSTCARVVTPGADTNFVPRYQRDRRV